MLERISEGDGLTKICGQLPSELGSSDVVVGCLVRNGVEYLPDFLEHYSRLGVAHFVFISNNSTDGTLGMLAKQGNTTVYSCDLPYELSNMAIKQYLIDKYAVRCWLLLVDIDEFFDYPYSDIVDVGQLAAYLNYHKYTAVLAQMLDLFSEEAIGETSNTGVASLFELFPFYELSSIEKSKYNIDCNQISSDEIMLHYGGIRNRVFKVGKISLFKHAMIHNAAENIRLLGTHAVCNAYLADFSAVVYHFKFTNSFVERVKEAVLLENYYQRSVDYKAIEKVLSRSGRIVLKTGSAKRLNNVGELVDCGFLTVSDRYAEWVESQVGIEGIRRSRAK
jgi:hypothetical protein